MKTPNGYTIFESDVKAIRSGLIRKPQDVKALGVYIQMALERGGENVKTAASRAEMLMLAAIHEGYDTLLGMLDGEEYVTESSPTVVQDMATVFAELDNLGRDDDDGFEPGVKEDLEFEMANDPPDWPTPDPEPEPEPEPKFSSRGAVTGRMSSGQPNPAPDVIKREDAEKYGLPKPTLHEKIESWEESRGSQAKQHALGGSYKPSVEDFRPTKEEVEKIIADKKATDDLKQRIEEIKAVTPPDERTHEERKADFVAQFADPFSHVASKPSFTPSKYQQDIFDWVTSGTGHALVNAVAGSGKTTTVVEAAKLMKGRALFLAFNRHIKLELESRLPTNCEVMTLNGFGWKICRDNVRGAKLPGRYDKQKDDVILLDVLANEPNDAFYKQTKKAIFRMVGLLKALGESNADRYEEHAAKYGIELGEVKDKDKFSAVLKMTYGASVNRLDLWSFDDQLFQPIHRGWGLPAYDWVVIDEMQDCSPIQITLAERLAESGRILGVGDPDQSIYLFRGAHPDAMNTVAESLDARWMPLSTCYRCPDAVIEVAREEVPRIEAPQPNSKGVGVVDTIETEEFVRNVSDGDMVLCRTTAPLVKRCLEQLRRGKKAYVKGRDVSEQLIDLIEQIFGQRFDRRKLQSLPDRVNMLEMDHFISKLEDYSSAQAAKLERAGRDIELMMLEDKVETIKALADEETSVLSIVKRIDRIFSDDQQEGIAFMTGHKAKGLESDTVYILRPDLCPHPKAKDEAQRRQEKNLKYVMKTRAMKELWFVAKEKDEK